MDFVIRRDPRSGRIPYDLPRISAYLRFFRQIKEKCSRRKPQKTQGCKGTADKAVRI